MLGTGNISIFVAASAGFLSFLSPCVLPLIPSYIAFITGVSLEELSSGENLSRIRRVVVVNSLMFILGFSLIFMALGASATFLGQFLSSHIRWLEIGGGIIVIFLGLHFAGVFRLSFLEREKKIHLQEKPMGLFGTLLVGMAFGAGWTPCVGPILGTILTMAATTQNLFQGMMLLCFYSLGIGIPFLLSGLILHKFFEYFKSLRKHFKTIATLGGILLILIGILLITGYFSSLSSYLSY
ncbi:sulfite exporter TauE/SafE family protein [bacterium]|nr:sulfite exporter TauE/SafE family protein [bacterium]